MPTRKPAPKTAKKSKKAAAARSTKTPTRRAAAAKPAARRSSGLDATVAVGVTVDDIAKSLDWYTGVLGFVIKDKWEADGVVSGAELKAGTAVLYLGQDDWKKGRDRKKGEGMRLHFWTTQDIDALLSHIKSRGVTLIEGPIDAYGARMFSIEDPTGYKITMCKQL